VIGAKGWRYLKACVGHGSVLLKELDPQLSGTRNAFVTLTQIKKKNFCVFARLYL